MMKFASWRVKSLKGVTREAKPRLPKAASGSRESQGKRQAEKLSTGRRGAFDGFVVGEA
jgi:hypothetical protein